MKKRKFTDVVLFSTNPKYLSEAARAERERVNAERQARDEVWKAEHPGIIKKGADNA
jgi:hypothetical protein